MVKRSDIRSDYVKEKIHNNKLRGFRPIELKTQMRNKAGDSYVNYIYDILYQRSIQKQTFENLF